MREENGLHIQVVQGGYILTTYGPNGDTEVFMSSGKLLKAVRTFLDGDKPVAEDKTE